MENEVKAFDMKARFKSYLEAQFRQIPPTKAAMELRKTTLVKMLDRAQELRIKGINDEELICSMVIGELGDFASSLQEFQNKKTKKDMVTRGVKAAAALVIGLIVLLTITYITFGAVTGFWHPGWMIMLGGIFAGIIAAVAFVIAKLAKKQRFVIVRLLIALSEVLVSVFVFLLLQLVFKLNGSWLTFLAMVILIAGVDTAAAFALNAKGKWIELPIFVEIFCVMLYVMLGIILGPITGAANIWHPGWILCLGGFVAFAVEIVVFAVAKKKAANQLKVEEDTYSDESYWTEWDD